MTFRLAPDTAGEATHPPGEAVQRASRRSDA